MNSTALLLNELEKSLCATHADLHRVKKKVARSTHSPFVRNGVLLHFYRQQLLEGVRSRNEVLERLLVLNSVRSVSGIATVTVLTKPFPCPGRCVYCPTESKAPKSYLMSEPPVMRAVNHDYDPFGQVMDRLTALENTGHRTDKIELIVKGGTWSAYPETYREEFIRRCFDAANGGPLNSSVGETVQEAHQQNEKACHRIIGLTVETRPDEITYDEIQRFRRWGVTRVELGVQSLNEDILRLIVRDHTARETALATQQLRNAGFKVTYHWMPNLPGATPESDLEDFKILFDNPAYRPDAIKIYPCVVIRSAELYRWWLAGRYQPYEESVLRKLLIEMKKIVPAYVRIERIVRDISAGEVATGVRRNNLREELLRQMNQEGIRCWCIRCREVRDHPQGEFLLTRREYETSGGTEIFLSFEETASHRLAALLRLRIPSVSPTADDAGIKVLQKAALVRELHIYGWHLSLKEKSSNAAQHQRFGRRLMAEAERITREEYSFSRVAIISGIGVRDYYRRLGYECADTYMVKTV